MSYFDGIKVGDKIWTIQEGWTEVINIRPAHHYQIETLLMSYTTDGLFREDDKHQSAFWSDPHIVPPPRTKRKVKMRLEVRPYYSDFHREIRLYPNDSNPVECVNFCGPIQTVEVEVSE